MKKVLAFGVFDKLHPGHINFLQQAKALGDHLSVVIARDNNVKKIKGRLPTQNENQRLANVKNIDAVDNAILGFEDYSKRIAIISQIKPDIIALGYDQAELKLKNKKIKIIYLQAHQPEKYKSSLLP